MGKEENYEDNYYWSATNDFKSKHPMDQSLVEQEAAQSINNTQISNELIMIKDSCNIDVSTTDTKIALSIQAALQAALVAVISISLGSSSRAEAIVQDLTKKIHADQGNHQKILIENSKEVYITTTDPFIAVNIQVLFQILLTLVVRIDVL